MDYGMYEEALKWNKLYLNLKNAWIEEVFEAQMRISICMMKLEYDRERIYDEMLKAINIFSDRAEPHYKIGLYFNQIGDFEMGYKHLKIAKSMSLDEVKKKYILFIDDTSYNNYVNDELSVSCYWTKRYDEGLYFLNSIITDPLFESHKERLTQNFNFFMDRINEGN